MDAQEFIRQVASLSEELWVEGSRIYPSVRVAQALLETGGNLPSWNNAFGIKVGNMPPNPYWDGSYVIRSTREVIHGQNLTNVQAEWRAYKSLEDSVRDHELFLQQGRYTAVREAVSPKQQCDALYAAGYATDAPASVDGDPSYAEKLWAVITSRGYLDFDTTADRLKQELPRRIQALELTQQTLSGRVAALESREHMAQVPGWAKEAVDDAVEAGLVKNPEGGSYDFYRIITVMNRKGIL